MIKNKRFRIFDFSHFGFFGNWKLEIGNSQKGVTLLLVILVLSAVLSISLGIFDVVFTELRLSGEIADSFTAFYAADEAIEKGFYQDRGGTPLCSSGSGENCYDSGWVTLANGACSRLRASKIDVAPGITDITLVATGEFRCRDDFLGVKRAFSVSYRVETE